MAFLFMDGFGHYGDGNDVGRDNMLDNVYAQVDVASGPSQDQSRNGNHSLALGGTSNVVRRAFSAAVGEVFVGFAVYPPELPNASDALAICQLRDNTNAASVSLTLGATGDLSVREGGPTSAIIASTSGPVIGASAWNHVELRAVQSTGTVQVRVDGVTVINTSSFTIANDFAQWAVQSQGVSGLSFCYFDDVICNDNSGTYNNTWKGDLRVATLFPDTDGTPSGWARVGRDVFGAGVLFTDGGCVYVADDAALNLGSGDYTIEFFVNFYDEPASGRQTIAGQWDELNNQRSWILYRDFDDGGNLKLDISTDGTDATVSTILNWSAWSPQIGRTNFLSISRVSGVTYLHVEGRQQGSGVADSNTYHNSTSPLWLGHALRGTGSTVTSGDVSDLFMDEFRFTVGTGRYSDSNYTVPASAFPRGVSDPNWADVELLFGFNSNPITDESTNAFSVSDSSSGDPRSLNVSSDANGKFAVVDEATPLDYTYIAADFLFATGELTLSANPTASETVTLGSTTYTFVASLTGADDVLIGADANESLENLAAAINGGAGEGTVYGTGTTANSDATASFLGGQQLRATAATQGAAGNSVTSTETLTDGEWTGSTLSGGADIPSAQEFEFSPLPIDTTQVKGIQLVHRSSKSDTGACQLQTSFHVGASSADGTDRAITQAFGYWSDIFEEDPDTSAGLTVNSIQAGAFQINRTT